LAKRIPVEHALVPLSGKQVDLPGDGCPRLFWGGSAQEGLWAS
jgi:hypothetical protein